MSVSLEMSRSVLKQSLGVTSLLVAAQRTGVNRELQKISGPRYHGLMQRHRSRYDNEVMTGASPDWDERIGRRLTLRDLNILSNSALSHASAARRSIRRSFRITGLVLLTVSFVGPDPHRS